MNVNKLAYKQEHPNHINAVALNFIGSSPLALNSVCLSITHTCYE